MKDRVWIAPQQIHVLDLHRNGGVRATRSIQIHLTVLVRVKGSTMMHLYQ